MVLDGQSSNAVTRKYIWGLDLSGTFHNAGGIGGLLAAYETQGTTSTADDARYWFMYDANGNVGQILDATDTQSITLAAAYEYDAYGNLATAPTGPYAAANPFRFSTKWHDAETDLYYYGYRYYSPTLGRWLSRDPIGEIGGVNLYGFLGNGPLGRYDILGNLWGIGACGPCMKVKGEKTGVYMMGGPNYAVNYSGINLPLPPLAGILTTILPPSIPSWAPLPDNPSMYGAYNLRAGATCYISWGMKTECQACCSYPWGGAFTKTGTKTKWLGYTFGTLEWKGRYLECNAFKPSSDGKDACTDKECW